MLKPTLPKERPPFVTVMRHLGLIADDWQVDVLESAASRMLLNCSRQAGKSTVVAVMALVKALWEPITKVLIVSRSHRQAKELFRQVTFFHKLLGDRLLVRRTAEELELDNLSRIVCVPCKEETIRGFAHVDLLIIDEAARVPDTLYRSVRPMLAVSKGRLICLSTPYGKRGFFWDAWARGGDDWLRIEVPATKVARIGPEFLEAERQALGESWFKQEYCCSFEAVEGLVYPDFARCVTAALPAAAAAEDCGWKINVPGPAWDEHSSGRRRCRRVGGIDFGFRNPLAAIWGLLDAEGTLWLTGEHYGSGKPLSDHARRLPRDVEWFVDPAGAGEKAELRRADFCVRSGKNALREGIAAVSARLQDGSLKVLEGRCPNLLREAGLYRYEDGERTSETPLDADNHALAALRYLIATIDVGRMSRIRGEPHESQRRGMDADDDRLWGPMGPEGWRRTG
jgi:hypothetical protein